MAKTVKLEQDGKRLRELLAEFEAIVAWFDGDELDIETAMTKFQEGAALAEQIKQQLAAAKNQIEVVKGRFERAERG